MNEQALEDSANLRNVKPKGTTEDLTMPNTPWIYYCVRADFVELFGCSWMAGLTCRGKGSSHTCVLL